MAKIEGRPTLTANIVMVLNESEAAALDAVVGYGIDGFLKVFYKEMGESYLKPHEGGLRSLFSSVRTGDASTSAILTRLGHARKVFSGEYLAVPAGVNAPQPAQGQGDE